MYVVSSYLTYNKILPTTKTNHLMRFREINYVDFGLYETPHCTPMAKGRDFKCQTTACV